MSTLFALEDGIHAPITGGAVLSATRKGEIAEKLFEVAAMVHDFEVFTPAGHAQTADLCVVKPGFRPMLVQVKTGYMEKDCCDSYSVNVSRGTSEKVAYKRGDFDVLAAYLPKHNQFVLWTFEDLQGRKKLRYSPTRHRKPGNWDLLNDVAESLTISGHGTTNVPPHL